MSMVNATWDEPAVAPTIKRAKEHRQRTQSLKSLLSSPSKTLKPSSSRKSFKSDKGIDRLLSLLRTPSFCGQSSLPEDERVPRTIVCDIGVLKQKAPRTLDERIKRMSMSDSKTSASSLSDDSLLSLVSLDNDKKTGADSRKEVPVDALGMTRVQSFQTA